MYRNELIELQLNHRSIREFESRPVEEEKLEALIEVASHTATSMGLQQASIIRVTEPEKRRRIMEATTQEYVERAPELWIFLADTYRNTKICSEKGLETKVGLDMDHFFQGFTDAILMAQNVNLAIESMGMGAVFLGSIMNDQEEILETLELPAGTYPAVGMIFGYPAQSPQLKPRMPMKFRFFEDRYEAPESWVDALADYDAEMTEYYDLRDANRRVDCFTDQVVKKYAKHLENRMRIIEIAENNGFLPPEDCR